VPDFYEGNSACALRWYILVENIKFIEIQKRFKADPQNPWKLELSLNVINTPAILL